MVHSSMDVDDEAPPAEAGLHINDVHEVGSLSHGAQAAIRREAYRPGRRHAGSDHAHRTARPPQVPEPHGGVLCTRNEPGHQAGRSSGTALCAEGAQQGLLSVLLSAGCIPGAAQARVPGRSPLQAASRCRAQPGPEAAQAAAQRCRQGSHPSPDLRNTENIRCRHAAPPGEGAAALSTGAPACAQPAGTPITLKIPPDFPTKPCSLPAAPGCRWPAGGLRGARQRQS